MKISRIATAVVLCLAISSVSPASVFSDPFGSHLLVGPRFDLPDESSDKQLLDTFSTSTHQVKPEKPNILMFHVESEISNRYAKTLVKSRVANPANVSQEVVFSIIIPDTAFITSFAMEIDGKIYKAYVKEKEEAKRVYNEAVSSGHTAAHVSARDADRFSVAVNIEAQSKVSFNLTYEELLQLTHGLYKHAININPGQIVKDMTIDIHIVELKEITNLRVNDVQSANEIDNEVSENPKAQVEWISPNETKIHFKADEEEQRRLEKKNKQKSPENNSNKGIAGKFVIEYNVQRDPSGGEVIVNDGYFVHFFAPHELPQLSKHVLFVLDVSGSMMGRKLEQLKEAMTAILDELSPNDFFNIIEFSYSVTVRNLDGEVNSAVYQPFASFPHSFYQDIDDTTPENNNQNTRPFPATDEYKQKAKRIIEKMTAGGGTNINDALKTAVEIAKRGVYYNCDNSTEISNDTESNNKTETNDKTCTPVSDEGVDKVKLPQTIIIFLTDGEPTVGETRPHKIQSAINEINSSPKSPIFSLAFGEGADYKFLKGLSLANNGFSRQIYEAADAQKQLNNFYRLLASPLLANVTFKYPPEVNNETLTKHVFSNLFKGSELVIAGKVDSGYFRGGEIEAQSSKGLITYDLPEPRVTERKYGALERLWAYLTIKQLLDEQDVLEATTSQYAMYPDPEDKDKETNSSNKTVQPKEKALEIALKGILNAITSMWNWFLGVFQMLQTLWETLSDPYIYVSTSPEKVPKSRKERALELAIKYSFVCPLTSLVVVKPNGTDKLNTESAAPTDAADKASFGSHYSAFGPPAGARRSNYRLKGRSGSSLRSKLNYHSKPRLPQTAMMVHRQFTLYSAHQRPSAASGLSFASPSSFGFQAPAMSVNRRIVGGFKSAPAMPSLHMDNGYGSGGVIPESMVDYEDSDVDVSGAQANRLSFMPARTTTFKPTQASSFDRLDEDEPEVAEVSIVTDVPKNIWVDDLLREGTLNVSEPGNHTKAFNLLPPNDIERSPCTAANVSGVCYPLSAFSSCSMEEISDLDTYKERFLCELSGQYAGVCCIQPENSTSVSTNETTSESIPTTTEEEEFDQVGTLPPDILEEIRGTMEPELSTNLQLSTEVTQPQPNEANNSSTTESVENIDNSKPKSSTDAAVTEANKSD